MIIALFGRSCSGKTVLGSAVASALNISVRHCGDAVREVARAANVGIDDLSIDQHQRVDQATYQWSSSSGTALVEGRFLQYVLSEFDQPLLLIEVIGSASVRAARWENRVRRPFDEQALAEMDRGEDRLVESLYSSTRSRTADLTIDTTSLSIDECVKQVAVAVSQRGQ